MSEAESLFGEEHVRRYRETGGAVGHIWREGSTILLLTTTGRKSGEKRTVPLIYAPDGDRYVIFGSKGGAPEESTPAGIRTSRRVPRSSCRGKTRCSGRGRGSRRARSVSGCGDSRTRSGSSTTITRRRRSARSRLWCWSGSEPPAATPCSAIAGHGAAVRRWT